MDIVSAPSLAFRHNASYSLCAKALGVDLNIFVHDRQARHDTIAVLLSDTQGVSGREPIIAQPFPNENQSEVSSYSEEILRGKAPWNSGI